MLTVRLLGPMEVLRGDTAVALPRSRKTRALLAYLALADKPIGRSQLIQLLWEEPGDPRGALRWSLSKLREIVDEEDARRIVADRERVFFECDDVAIDARHIRQISAEGLQAQSVESLEAAAALFRGSFLDGMDLADSGEFHAWYLERVSEFEVQQQRILTLLCERHRDAPERALPFAAALARLLPDDDTALTRLDAVRSAATSGASRRLVTTESDPLADADASAAGEDPGGRELTAAMLLRPAVAVLPFTNMSGDREQDYFADGITEDIITGLCNWRWFPVIARNSSFAFKGQNVDVVNVGRQLGARYLLEGSVRKAGSRIRVTAQLIDTSQGHHIWAQRYDRELDDVFAIQDELTAQIVAQIEPALARSERLRRQHLSSTNLDAWDLNHRALAVIHSGRASDFEAAEELLQQSLSLDPHSSHTHALLSLCLYHRGLLIWHRDPLGSIVIFKEAAQRAVNLDEDNWLGHALLGLSLLWKDRDYDGAAEETSRATELNPSAALAHQFVGCVYNFDGHPGDAILHLQAAVRLNPHPNAATLLLSDLALAHVLLHRYDEAIPFAKRAIANFSGDIRAWQRLSSALGHLGRREEALEALGNLQRYQRRLTMDYVDATYPFRNAEDREIFVAGLLKAGWRPDEAAPPGSTPIR